jgi:glycosyltransferase involved in cell wall biosynthesis
VRSRRDGSDANDPVVVLSIGRKVEKKGFGDLLDALALLPKTLHWRFEHIGAGELGDLLKAQAERLGIAERCTWLGAPPQKQVFAALARADLCVLASKKAADGDQDGLPNVLMEAAHQGLAIVSTRAAAIGEFIEDGDNGLLAPPRDAAALAGRLEQVLGDEALRARLGERARATIEQHYSTEVVCGQLSALYRELAGTQ